MMPASAKDRLGAGILAACAAGLLCIAAVRGCLTTTEPGGSASSPESSIKDETVILLDGTDDLQPRQASELQIRLDRLSRNDLRAGEVVTLWLLGSSPEGRLRRLFSRRFPGRRANPILQNPRQVSARCDSLFDRPLQEAVAQAGGAGETSASPIMAAIQDLADELRAGGARHRRLIVVSDGMENADGYSHYRVTPDFVAFSHTARWREVRASLQGATVEVWYVTRARDEARQGVAHRRFWEAYLKACGASRVRISRL